MRGDSSLASERDARLEDGCPCGAGLARTPFDYCRIWKVIHPDRLEFISPRDGEVLITDGK